MIHEDISREEEVEIGSERAFGLVFAAVFLLIGLYPLLGGGGPRWWGVGLAALMALIAFVAPRRLAVLNRLWFRFGLLLAAVVNPVVLGLVFFTTVIPIGLLMRLFGKDPLRTRLEPEADSYWIPRDPPGPEPSSMRNQF